MKTLLLLAVTMAFGLLQTHGNLLDFRKMIWWATGKEAVTSYAFYGCHCGMGGKGSPKDATDWCCVTHDCCYTQLQRRGCGTKLLSYKFAYRGGQIVCGDFPSWRIDQSKVTCYPETNHCKAKQDYCRSQLCQCDKTAASCFARNRNTYKKKYQYYNNWWCSGRAPKC